MESQPVNDTHDEAAARDVDAIAPNAPALANGEPKPKTLGAVLTRVRMMKHQKTARPLQRVELPWLDETPGEGTHMWVRGLSASGKDKFDDTIYSMKGGTVAVKVVGVRALMIALCACDAEGKRIFSDEDVPMLEELDGKTADAIYVVAARESNLTQKDVEDAVKN